jgi:uncharacterized membrane protein
MRISGFGHALFGISMAGLALLSVAYGNFAPILEPFPPSLPWLKVLTYALGVVLLAASAGLFFARAATMSAMVLAMYGLAWTAASARDALRMPKSVGSWYGICEAIAALVGAWILYALLLRQSGAAKQTAVTSNRALLVARILFGAACVEYGAAHFAYTAYTASFVPSWFPARTGLVYLTGAFHAAAGFGLLFGILPWLAATLEGTMMALFGVVVWLPTFFTRPAPDWASPDQTRWSETFLTFLLAGSAWIVAASLQRGSRVHPGKIDGASGPYPS